MTTYTLDYISKMLRQAIYFADVEKDFTPLCKWVHQLDLAIAENDDAPSAHGQIANPEWDAELFEANAGDALEALANNEDAGDVIRERKAGGQL